MKNKTIKCPHCGDEWSYLYKVDYEDNKCVVTSNYDFINEGQECTCYKCHATYYLKTNEPADIRMDNFVYNVWRHCKM